MAKMNALAQAIALAGIVNRVVNPDTMNKLIVASNATAKLSPEKLSEDQREKLGNAKDSLLTVARQAVFELVTATNDDGERIAASGDAVQVLVGLAVQNGASENTLSMYSSTLARFADAVGRSENPADPAKLTDEKVTYAKLRQAIATPDEAARADLKERYRLLWQDLSDAERLETVQRLEALTEKARTAREAKKAAKRDGRVGATSAASTGPVSHVDPMEPGTDEDAGQAADAGGDGMASVADVAAAAATEQAPARPARGQRH